MLGENRAPPPPPCRYRHWVAYLNWLLALNPQYSETLVTLTCDGSLSSSSSSTSTSPICNVTQNKSEYLFLTSGIFSGGLHFALYSVRLRGLVVQLYLLSRYSLRVALYTAHWPPVWLPRLLSHWSGGRTVPLTLVLRLLASAELRLYHTSFPCLIVSRTI